MNRHLRRTQAMRRLDIIAERRAQAPAATSRPPLPDHVDPFIDQPVVILAGSATGRTTASEPPTERRSCAAATGRQRTPVRGGTSRW